MNLVEPSKAPRLGKGGSPQSRVAILHSLAHIESWAIDLSWDIIARFGAPRAMPCEFFDEFVAVAVDEARHFKMLAARLEALGSRQGVCVCACVQLLGAGSFRSVPRYARIYIIGCTRAVNKRTLCSSYGALNAHDGLWNSAAETSYSLEARLVIEHCVHEARGLDVLPMTIGKFRKNGDEASAELLELVIYPEEVTHCAAGVRWFTHLHERGDHVRWTSGGAGKKHEGAEKEEVVEEAEVAEEVAGSAAAGAGAGTGAEGVGAGVDVVAGIPPGAGLLDRFHAIVRHHFAGVLKPPFNDEARARAGFGPEWYMPLSVRPAAAAPADAPADAAAAEQSI